MGKRRRDHLSKTPPPDFMPYSARVDSSSKEKPYNSVGTSSLKPLPSIMNIMDSSAKLPKYHLEPSYHYHNFSRTILPRHSRNYFGRQYSRRNSAYHGDTSTSHGKSTPSREEKLSSKFAGQCSAESRHHTGTETREKASRRPERIRSSPSPVNTVSADVVKMVCGICQKLLKRKPHFLGNTISSSDISVVAVLVCGHNYHADCLEQKTCHEDRRDPPCPLCVGLLSAAHASRGQD